MKRLLLLIFTFVIISCDNSKYKYLGQDVVDGKVSSIQPATYGYRGAYQNAIMWVQDDRSTRKVIIPQEFENKWKVGDNCLLIIEKYAIVENGNKTK